MKYIPKKDANLLYKGVGGLILLCVDENKTVEEVRSEDLKGHGTYPHLYGPLNLDAVTEVLQFPSEEDESFTLPKGPCLRNY